MKTQEEIKIKAKIKQLQLVRSQLRKDFNETKDKSLKEQLTVVNNKIMMLKWGLLK